MNLNLGVQVSPRVRFRLGYSLLTWLNRFVPATRSMR